MPKTTCIESKLLNLGGRMNSIKHASPFGTAIIGILLLVLSCAGSIVIGGYPKLLGNSAVVVVGSLGLA